MMDRVQELPLGESYDASSEYSENLQDDAAQPTGQDSNGSAQKNDYFHPDSLTTFARAYPEQPHTLRHTLGENDLLNLDALAALADQLPARDIEYNTGLLPVGLDGKPASNGLTIGETIKQIASNDSWAVLKNIQQAPAYEALLMELLEELRPHIEASTGKMLTPQGFIFISSPLAVTPYHFDPEHNILLQLKGKKVMTQFPAGDTQFASDEAHENYHTGGPRELRWTGGMAAFGTDYAIGPGDAVFVPVKAPHFVTVGSEASLSLSITWRSEWSYAEADARAFNQMLRKMGASPRAPGRWPSSNIGKSIAFRALRKLGRAQ